MEDYDENLPDNVQSPCMDGHASVVSELETVDRLIADATERAAELEKAIGVMQAVNGDAAAADTALMATYQSLGLLTKRRLTLMKILQGYDGSWSSSA